MNRPRIAPDLEAQVAEWLTARDTRQLGRGRPESKLKVVNHGDAAEMLIYDEISYWGVSASDVAEQLTGLHGDLNVRINSPGGDVFDGVAIYNMLVSHPGKVTVTVEGLAASAASFIAMAGDRIVMGRGAQMMIHDASGFAYGNAADMTEMAALLDRVSDTIASIYAGRTGVDAATWREAMRAESWYDGEEAVEAGLADEVARPSRQPDQAPDEPMAARWDLSVFRFAGRAQAPAPDLAPGGPARGPELRNEVPGWEGTVGPLPSQYRDPHVYARDVHSGAGNCVCGAALVDELHVQAAPGVPVPGRDDAPPATNGGTVDEGGPAVLPVPEPGVPAPTPAPVLDGPAPDQSSPAPSEVDEWTALAAHLTNPPSIEDEWARLREALL